MTPCLNNSSKQGLNRLYSTIISERKLCLSAFLGNTCRSHILNKINHIHLLNHLFWWFMFFQSLKQNNPPHKTYQVLFSSYKFKYKFKWLCWIWPVTLLVSWINEQSFHFNLLCNNCQKWPKSLCISATGIMQASYPIRIYIVDG